ncbi:hypothetical protein D3C84_1278830 [compost metagenome]
MAEIMMDDMFAASSYEVPLAINIAAEKRIGVIIIRQFIAVDTYPISCSFLE